MQHVYESMVRALPGITVFVFGPDLRYWLIEGTGFAELGWSQEEIVGRRPIDVMAAEPDGARKLEDAMEAALSGRTVTVEIRGLRRSTGTTRSRLFARRTGRSSEASSCPGTSER